MPYREDALQQALNQNVLDGTMTVDELQDFNRTRGARMMDQGLSIVQGINDIPRAVTGLATAGQWQDTNPFVQVNNYLESVRDNGKTYQPNVADNLVNWGLREAPQIIIGRKLGQMYNNRMRPTGVNLSKTPVSRFSHPVEIYWNAGAEVGKGITDPNISTADAFRNGALNLIPFAGRGNPVATNTLGGGR